MTPLEAYTRDLYDAAEELLRALQDAADSGEDRSDQLYAARLRLAKLLNRDTRISEENP